MSDLLAALGRAGLRFDLRDSALQKLGIIPKTGDVDVEFARQLALLACSCEAGQPLVKMVTSSPWNRFLPERVESYPTQNQFQMCRNSFDNAFFLSRGWILPEDM